MTYDSLPPKTRLLYERMALEQNLETATNPNLPLGKREEAVERLIEDGHIPVGNLDKPLPTTIQEVLWDS